MYPKRIYDKDRKPVPARYGPASLALSHEKRRAELQRAVKAKRMARASAVIDITNDIDDSSEDSGAADAGAEAELAALFSPPRSPSHAMPLSPMPVWPPIKEDDSDDHRAAAAVDYIKPKHVKPAQFYAGSSPYTTSGYQDTGLTLVDAFACSAILANRDDLNYGVQPGCAVLGSWVCQSQEFPTPVPEGWLGQRYDNAMSHYILKAGAKRDFRFSLEQLRALTVCHEDGSLRAYEGHGRVLVFATASAVTWLMPQVNSRLPYWAHPMQGRIFGPVVDVPQQRMPEDAHIAKMM